MMSIDSPLFRGSQWFHCKNSTGTAIPPYGIAESVGMGTAIVGDISQPVMLVRVAQTDNPKVTVFTGPLGVPGNGFGICHSGDFGYARTTQGSFTVGTNQKVSSGETSLSRGVGDFFEIGDTVTVSGTTVGLFHKKSKVGTAVIVHTGSGVPALAGSIPGTAELAVYNLDAGTLTSAGYNVDVYNLAQTAHPASCYYRAVMQEDGTYLIDPPAITDLQLSGLALQHRRNCGWTTWLTGEECASGGGAPEPL